MTIALPAVTTPAPPRAPARPPPRRALGRKLAVALIGLVGFVLIVNGAVNLWLNYREARATAVRLQQEKAQAAAERIGLFVAEIENQIGWTTRAEWSFVALDQRRYDFIRLLRQAPAITELVQVDAAGKEQLRLSRLEPDVVGSGADLSADPRFAQALANKIWFSPVTFRHGSEPYMTIALAQASKKPGVTSAEVNLKLIWDAVNAIRIGDTGNAYVVDARGKLIAHPDISLVLRDTDLSALPQVAAALASRSPGPHDFNTDTATAPEGGTVLTAHALIPRLGWAVFVQQPLREALAPLYVALIQTAVLLGLGLLLASLLGLTLARRITAPIRLLQAGAAKLGAGDLSQRLSVRTGDEIEALADQFNLMAGQVQDSYATLEGRVEARTHELGEALARQTATSDILRVIGQSPTDVVPVFSAIVEAAVRLLACDMAVAVQSDNMTYSPVAGATPAGPMKDMGPSNLPIDPSQNFPSRAIVSKSTVHLPDWSAIALPPHEQRIHETIGINSALNLPLVRRDECLGVLIFGCKRAHVFSGEEIALAESFRDQALIAIENARLFTETQEALERQTATSEILRVISQSPTDVQPVFDAIVTTARRLFSCDMTAVMLCDTTAYHLMSLADADGPRKNLARAAIPLNPQANFPSRAILAKKMLYLPDWSQIDLPEHERRVHMENGVNASLFLPLLREAECIGLLALTSRRASAFSAADIAIAESFRDQALIAIENTRLFNETREALERQTATADILKVIASSPSDVQPVFEAIATSANRLLGGFSTTVFRFIDETLQLVAFTPTNRIADDALQASFPMPRADFPPYEMVREGKAVQFTDTEAQSTVPSVIRNLARLRGYRSMLFTALMSNHIPVGMISVTRKEPGSFAAHHVQLLQTFADQAVIAIQNVRLFEDVQEALAQQTATADVLKVISRSAFDLQPVFDSLTVSATSVCSATGGAIWLREGDVFHARAATGDTLDFFQANPRRLDDKSITPRVARSGKVEHIPDLQLDAEYAFPGAVAVNQMRTLLGVPLLRDGKVEGVFTLWRTEASPFTQRQIELVETFADQAVIAIQNVRLFDEVKARTRDLAEALAQQTATADVLKVISRSAFDLQAVLDTLINTAVRVCAAGQGAIYQKMGDLFHWVAQSSDGFSAEFVDFARAHPFAPGTGSITARVALTGKVVHIKDVLADPEYVALGHQRLGNYRTMLGVPFLREGVPIGVFTLVREHVEAFTDRQIELVTSFADQAVIAIENVRLFDEVQARTKQLSRSVGELKALGEVGAAITATLDLQKVQATIVTRAVELAGADAGAIFRYRKSDRTFRMTQAAGLAADHETALRALNVPELESVMGEAVRSMQVAQVADIATRPSFPLRDAALAAGFHAVLILPLAVPGRTLGALVLQKREVGEFPDNVVNLMRTFASQSVLAIQNARLFEEIAENSRQLEIASQHKSQFLANMSHELRTPLNAILGYAELLVDGIYGELADKPRGVLERVQQNGRHLLGLINDVLDLSKIEAGQLTLTLEEYALPGLVDSVVATTASLAQTKGLKLLNFVAAGMPPGYGDSRRLTQVLLNLVGNALKFTDVGEVRIDAACSSGRFRIAVTDTGPGIAEDDQKRIFEEFRQVDNTSTRNKGGSGLGLAISTRIVEMHGGTITVASAPGAGSTFTIDLPVRAQAKVAP